MAIITISQIKHRRGVLGSDPMPQLASAEVGWAVDQQELYIGNGTISEGAPATGNTKILTEHSNLIALLSDYTYAGPFSGATMQTGASPGTPVSRSFSERYDDSVNVRGFGATGDGATDDLPALERAIFEHTLEQPLSNRYWTTIYVPAGTYRITSPLRLPSHVRLVGDGQGSTIISLDTSSTSVLEIIKMTDPNTLSDVFPTDIHVTGINFKATQDVSHGAIIGDASAITFTDVGFSGSRIDTTVIGTNNCAVLFNNITRPTDGITFNDCSFTGATYGVATGVPNAINNRQDITDVTINHSVFYDLFKGITLGREVDNLFPWPSQWRVTGCIFDVITTHGIHLFKTSKFTSGMNHFRDVGNAQVATPTTPCVVFGDFGAGSPLTTPLDLEAYQGNYSIGDTFDRTDADNAIVLRIKSNCLNSYIIDPSDIRYGTLQVEPGRLIRLVDNTAVAASTGITIDSSIYQGAVIDYQLNRGPDLRRTGTITLGMGDTTHNMTEDYTEVDPVGITFSSSYAAGVATINYISTDDTNDCVLSYSLRHLTCVAATPPVPTAPSLSLTFLKGMQGGFDTFADAFTLVGTIDPLLTEFTVLGYQSNSGINPPSIPPAYPDPGWLALGTGPFAASAGITFDLFGNENGPNNQPPDGPYIGQNPWIDFGPFGYSESSFSGLWYAVQVTVYSVGGATSATEIAYIKFAGF